MKNYKSDSGRSLLEALLYISLVSVMVVASVKMYSDYNQKIKRTSAQEQLDEISSKVNTLYFGRTLPTAGTSLNEKLTSNGVKLTDPWSKAISVVSDNETNYHITMTLNKTACIFLAMNTISKVKEPVINNIKDGVNDPLVNCNTNSNSVVFYYTTK